MKNVNWAIEKQEAGLGIFGMRVSHINRELSGQSATGSESV
jgi:hypothetical protein